MFFQFHSYLIHLIRFTLIPWIVNLVSLCNWFNFVYDLLQYIFCESTLKWCFILTFWPRSRGFCNKTVDAPGIICLFMKMFKLCLLEHAGQNMWNLDILLEQRL